MRGVSPVEAAQGSRQPPREWLTGLGQSREQRPLPPLVQRRPPARRQGRGVAAGAGRAPRRAGGGPSVPLLTRTRLILEQKWRLPLHLPGWGQNADGEATNTHGRCLQADRAPEDQNSFPDPQLWGTAESGRCPRAQRQNWVLRLQVDELFEQVAVLQEELNRLWSIQESEREIHALYQALVQAEQQPCSESSQGSGKGASYPELAQLMDLQDKGSWTLTSTQSRTMNLPLAPEMSLCSRCDALRLKKREDSNNNGNSQAPRKGHQYKGRPANHAYKSWCHKKKKSVGNWRFWGALKHPFATQTISLRKFAPWLGPATSQRGY